MGFFYGSAEREMAVVWVRQVAVAVMRDGWFCIYFDGRACKSCWEDGGKWRFIT